MAVSKPGSTVPGESGARRAGGRAGEGGRRSNGTTLIGTYTIDSVGRPNGPTRKPRRPRPACGFAVEKRGQQPPEPSTPFLPVGLQGT
jgi:hypothetical protein